MQRIFQDYLEGRGFKAIARALNREGVPSPTVGRRGSGSWAPSCIRSMLLNDRYRGVYIHGRVKKLRRATSVKRVRADPAEVIMLEIPEWRIVDDETFLAVQQRFAEKASAPRVGRRDLPGAKYPLSSIARCGVCGGAIGCARTKRRGEVVKTYACVRHKERGPEACPVTVSQPMDEVEDALIDFIQHNILTGAVLDNVLAEIRREIETQLPKREQDIATLEAELAQARTEQRRLARAVALADDVPELASELARRSARIQHEKAQIAASRKTPEEMSSLMATVETNCRERLRDLRSRAHRPRRPPPHLPGALPRRPDAHAGVGARRADGSASSSLRAPDVNGSDCVTVPRKTAESGALKVRQDSVGLGVWRPQRDLILTDLLIPFESLLLMGGRGSDRERS